MGKYKPPKTRIRVEKSNVQTEYWPQYKPGWSYGWIDFDRGGRHSCNATLTLKLKTGELEWARAVIDDYLQIRREAWERENNHTTEYITYP